MENAITPGTAKQGLVEPHLRVRLAIPTLRRDLRVSIEANLEERAPVSGGSALTEKKQARCVLCPRVADRKTKTACERCHRPVFIINLDFNN